MLIAFTPVVIVLLCGIITGLFTFLVLWLAPKNKTANRYISFLVLIALLSLFHNFLLASSIYDQLSYLYFLPIIFSMGIGPFLYLYVHHLTSPKALHNRLILIHLVPVMLQFCYYLYCFLQNGNTKYDLWLNNYKPYYKPLELVLTYISVIAYALYALQMIRTYKSRVNRFYSNSSSISLSWLHYLVAIYLAYAVLIFLCNLLLEIFHFSSAFLPADLFRCLIIFVIAFNAIRQNGLEEVAVNLDKTDQVIPAATVPLTPAKELPEAKTKIIDLELLSRVKQLVISEQLFLDPELNIADVAARLNLHVKAVSVVINGGLNKNFSSFVNELRVNHFIDLLRSGKYKHLSLLGLAMECGFNSKATFNRVFREITGEPPKNFKL